MEKNALDFAVAAQLGYLISAEGKGAEYWIVSEDRGFEACKDFGAALGVKVGVYTPSYNVQEARRASQEEERAVLKSLLPGYSPKVLALTQKCLVAPITGRLSQQTAETALRKPDKGRVSENKAPSDRKRITGKENEMAEAAGDRMFSDGRDVNAAKIL